MTNTWRVHTAAAIDEIKAAMSDIRSDTPNAWKEGLLLEAVQKLETTLDHDEADDDHED